MSRWATRALWGRVVGYGLSTLRGQQTVVLTIDSSEGRRTAHLTPYQARRVAQRLNDLAFHVEQMEREG